jgi:hypothetical protein
MFAGCIGVAVDAGRPHTHYDTREPPQLPGILFIYWIFQKQAKELDGETQAAKARVG